MQKSNNMELILSEWIGAGNNYVKLDDDSIIKLNVQNYISSTNEEEIKKAISKRNNITGKKEIHAIRIEEHLKELKIICKENIQSIISSVEHRNRIVIETSKINNYHKTKLNKEDVNPIIDFIEIKDELYVRTYQYAAEFEIKFGEKNTNTLKIKIEPRNLVSEANFIKMFETIFNFHRLENISGGKSNAFLLLYYLAFIGRLSEVLKHGLYREYVDLEENLTFLKERLNISEHLRLNKFNKHRIYCEFSELTPNNLINQTIKTTLNLIQKHFSRYKILQYEIRKIKSSFFDDDVSEMKFNINSIKTIRYNRQNKRYEEIMNYCLNILKNIGGSFSVENKVNYSAFYVDMNDLFEKYVEKKLIESSINDVIDMDFHKIKRVIKETSKVDNYFVETQNQGHYTLDEENVFTIKPDFLIKNLEGKVIAVADTKYKRLNINKVKNYGISSSDVYQLLSYAHKFNTNTIILIYPQPPDEFIEDLSFTIKIDNDNNNSKKLHICYVNLINKRIIKNKELNHIEEMENIEEV